MTKREIEKVKKREEFKKEIRKIAPIFLKQQEKPTK